MNGYIKKQALMDYCSNQVTRTIDLNDIARFPISEVFTKDEVIAMLEELKKEMNPIKQCEHQIYGKEEWNFVGKCQDVVQQRIKALRGDTNAREIKETT